MLKEHLIKLLGFIKCIKEKKAIMVRCIILFFMAFASTFIGCASTTATTSKSKTTANELTTPEKAVDNKEFIWRASNRQLLKWLKIKN